MLPIPIDPLPVLHEVHSVGTIPSSPRDFMASPLRMSGWVRKLVHSWNRTLKNLK